jgi:aspartate kinase
VALAAMLGASACEIYTDVDGVYTADPRICPGARKLSHIAFDEMLEMASLGAKVLQIRSVELAMNHSVPLRVRSTFSDDVGTLVGQTDAPIERINVVGVSHTFDEAKICLRRLPTHTGAVSAIFGRLAADGVNVDVIVQSQPTGGALDISFTLAMNELPAAQRALAPLAEAYGWAEPEISDNVGKVSIVGVGMMSHPGVAARMFDVLHQERIDIELISTSEIKVTCVLARADVERAVVALHSAFELDRVASEG